MLMKKHIIAALVGVMILAVTAPAFAANVGGNWSSVTSTTWTNRPRTA